MASLDTRDLIGQLQAALREQIAHAERLRELPLEVLQRRPAPDRWSVLEVISHMNLSSGHYHRHLERIYADENNRLRFRTTFTPGFWGERMTRSMAPRSDRSIGWKMRTLRMFEPRTANTEGLPTLDTFVRMCHGLVGLLERARARGIEGEKVVSSIGPMLRFKPGDAFRFAVGHQQRHMLQIERTLEALGAVSTSRIGEPTAPARLRRKWPTPSPCAVHRDRS